VKRDTRLIRLNELTDEHSERLERVFKPLPQLKQAYGLSRGLTQIFNQVLSVKKAGQQINGWMNEVEKSKLSCFETLIGTLKKHKTHILNYFDGSYNSGFVESLNNKIRVIKRRCYGL